MKRKVFLHPKLRRYNLQTIYYDRRAIVNVLFGNTDITIEEDYTLQVIGNLFSTNQLAIKKYVFQKRLCGSGCNPRWLCWHLLGMVTLGRGQVDD